MMELEKEVIDLFLLCSDLALLIVKDATQVIFMFMNCVLGSAGLLVLLL